MTASSKLPKRVFRIAGIYGLLITIPQYFNETRMGLEYPPPINHPENYYGFIGLTVAWQVMFLFIARDPVRYRPLMLPCILEKIIFPPAIFTLYIQSRVPGLFVGFACVDLVLGVLFWIAYKKTNITQ